MYGNAAFMTLREATQTTTENRAGRFTGVFDATYTPTDNITTTATFGVDATDDRSFLFRYFRYDVDRFTGNNITGQRAVDSRTNRQYTVDLKINWKSTLFGLQSDFVAGVQGFVVKEHAHRRQQHELPGSRPRGCRRRFGADRQRVVRPDGERRLLLPGAAGRTANSRT